MEKNFNSAFSLDAILKETVCVKKSIFNLPKFYEINHFICAYQLFTLAVIGFVYLVYSFKGALISNQLNPFILILVTIHYPQYFLKQVRITVKEICDAIIQFECNIYHRTIESQGTLANYPTII